MRMKYVVLLLGSFLLLVLMLSGCSSGTLPITPTATNQLAFLRYTPVASATGAAIRREPTRALRQSHRKSQLSRAAAAGTVAPGGYDIYLTSNISTPGTETKITTAGGLYESVRLSFDGTQAVFTAETVGSDDLPHLQIFVVNMNDPTNPTQITSDLEEHYDAQFSPDGTQIVYSFSNDLLSNDQLGIVPAAGGTENTDFPALVDMDVLNPTYTPDGQRIVFEDCNQDDLFIMNVDGSGLTQLTEQGTDRVPSVSPDGTKIVFERETLDGSDIFIMDIGGEIEGTPAVALTGTGANPATAAGVSYEPMFVNNKIVFVTDLDQDMDIDLYAMNADGSGIAALTDTVEDDCFSLYTLYW